MRLTDISIRALKAPSKGAEVFYDDTLTGFGVRVSEGGTKSFILTHGRRRQRETIGRVGVIALKDARAEAKRRLAEYTLGKEKPRAVTWGDAVQEYLAEAQQRLRPRTFEDYEYYLSRYFRCGETKLSELTPHDLRSRIERLSHAPAVKHRAFGILRAFLTWAYRAHYLDRSPLDRMKPPPPSKPRERVLNDDELVRVWQALDDSAYAHILKLLILTGQRRGEITGLTGGMVGTDLITLPGNHTKNGRLHAIPLGSWAASILGPNRPTDALYFPARGKTTPFNGFSKEKAELDMRCGFSDWTVHDLRRTFASGLASLGVQLPVVERLLNHMSGSFRGIVGVYQRYNFMPEMRNAIALWETHVAVLVREQEPSLPLAIATGPKLLTHVGVDP